ncbi:MAG: cyclase family protein [Acidobacteria bacterium]|nr:MAG: cyclase family protein [Acidobacteriota bacterium]
MSTPRWIDVSVPLRDGLVPWPGDPPFRLERVSDVARGDICTFSTLSMSAHAGTHIDAPLHFLRRGRTVDMLPLDATVGPARVVPIRNPRIIDPDELRSHRIRTGERLLFKTRNSARGRAGKFFEDYVAISPEAARLLASRRLRAIGIDGPSIGPFNDGAETHRVLLGAGIWIIEGLNLTRVPTGPCDLICLPLRIVGGDGAPARAILRPQRRR